MVKQRINCEVLIELMNNPLGVSTNKGNQGTTRGKHISSFVNSSCLQGSLGFPGRWVTLPVKPGLYFAL